MFSIISPILQNKKIKKAGPTSTQIILQYLRVPVGRVGEVADELELVQAVQVGEDFLGVAQVVGEDVVVVTHTLSHKENSLFYP